VNGSKLFKLLRTKSWVERAGWNTVQEKFKKPKTSHTKERSLTKTSTEEKKRKKKKKKQPEEKEERRNMKRGRTTLKRSKCGRNV